MPTAATLVPFGARAERTPYTVTLEARSFTYDPEPINVEEGGGEGGRLLQRGTEVRVTTDCTPQDGAGADAP